MALLRDVPYAPGFTPISWNDIIADADAFLDQWAIEAARLGWTDLDLFGVHPIAPAFRYDCMGLIPLIRGDEVIGISETRATTRSRSGNLLIYLRRPMTGAVLIWRL